MLLNFAQVGHKCTFTKLLKLWQKEFDTSKTSIEFLLEQNQNSMLIEPNFFNQFLLEAAHIEKMLNDQKIWVLPVSFYQENNGKKELYIYSVFKDTVRGMTEDEAKACSSHLPDGVVPKSSVYFLNKWNLKKAGT